MELALVREAMALPTPPVPPAAERYDSRACEALQKIAGAKSKVSQPAPSSDSKEARTTREHPSE